MQIRPLEDLTKEELIALILLERGQAEHIGAGGVPLMGDSKDAEIARLRDAAQAVIDSFQRDRAAAGRALVALAAALTQQGQV